MNTIKALPAETDRRAGQLPRTQTPPGWLVVAAFLAVYIIWGSTYLGIHVAIQSIPPLLMAGSRFVVAGLVLYAIMRKLGAPRPCAMDWRNATIVGALLLLVGNGGVSWAEQKVPTSIAALIIAATPLWIILIDWLTPGGTRPHPLVFAGLCLGFAGVGSIVLSKNTEGASAVDFWGASVLLLASICWASGSVYSRRSPQSESALLGVSLQMITGGALLLLGSFAFGELQAFNLHAITPASSYALIYLTLFGSLVGFTAYVWLLKVSTPARVSTYAFVNPLIAVLLGRLFLAEKLPEGILLAGLLILGAVMLITFRAPRAPS